jgi:hypothetical protein
VDELALRIARAGRGAVPARSSACSMTEPFPGPFLYYPSRRQLPPALAAFVAFVAQWRKRARKKDIR